MNDWIKDEYYRFIFDHSLDAIMLTRPNGKVFKANRAACEMLQRTEEEICREGREGIVDSDDPRLAPALAQRLRTGQIRAEMTFIRKDGTRIPVDVTSAIFKDDGGRRWTVIIARDITEAKHMEATLRKAQEDAMQFASYDYLTGTLNRKTFVDRLQQEMNRSKREERVLSLLLLDVDHFKSINDRLGHDAGDAVLQAFAMTIVRGLRPYDFCGRYGGDEFIVCLPNTTSRQAFSVAERLRKKIEGEYYTYQDHIMHLTASIGISSFDWDSFIVPSSELISIADQNMYIAKKRHNFVCGIHSGGR
jgi:diguanylate cyclase (GGDEF)-like protein/PAS domain S-box-containing protein